MPASHVRSTLNPRRWIIRTLAGIALSAVACWLFACALLFATQRMLLYPAVPSRSFDAATTRVLAAGDGTPLHASVRAKPGAPALLYLGGNREDVAVTLPRLAAELPGHALYLLHYRGYGAAPGEPNEAALQADALILFDAVAHQHPQVLLVGRSLGSGIAVRIAAQRPVAQLLLITPYDSIAAVATERFPWAPDWLVLDRYEAVRDAPAVRIPTQVWIAGRDAVIPRARTDALVRAFADGIVKVRLFADAGHNDLWSVPAFRAALRALGQAAPWSSGVHAGAGVR